MVNNCFDPFAVSQIICPSFDQKISCSIPVSIGSRNQIRDVVLLVQDKSPCIKRMGSLADKKIFTYVIYIKKNLYVKSGISIDLEFKIKYFYRPSILNLQKAFCHKRKGEPRPGRNRSQENILQGPA
jgi:hypothetical protein